jgi:hypothetical protein
VLFDAWDLNNSIADLRTVPIDGTVVEGLPSTTYWRFETGSLQLTTMVTPSTAVDDSSLSAFPHVVLFITTTSLPAGSLYSKTNKAAYSATLSAAGGNPPYKWSLASGSLPPGLKLTSKGVISGKAKADGTYSFTVQVVDTKTKTKPATRNKATATLSITIG